MRAKLAVLWLLTASAGLAQISFHPPASSPTQGGPVAMVTADFNGDGVPDLAMSDTGSQVVAIFLGNGDGTFRQASTYPVAGDCQMGSLLVGDFNGDHKPDLLGICEFGTQVFVFPGGGDGTFGAVLSTQLPQLAFAGTLFLEGILGEIGGTMGDFNGDGKVDLVLALVSDLSTLPPPGISGYFLPGKGDGTFGTALQIPNVNLAVRMTSGDFNGDGKLDLAYLTLDNGGQNASGGTIVDQKLSIALGNGDGTFRTGSSYPWTGATFALSAADLNGDGFVDLFAAGASLTVLASTFTPTSLVTVMLGDGKGNFKAGFTAADPSFGLAIGYCLADFSGKGELDLLETVAALSANFTTANTILGLRPGDGKGGFGSLQTFLGPTGIFPFSTVCADWNGDGLTDAVFTGIPYGQVLGTYASAGNLAAIGAALGQLPAGELYVSLNSSPAPARTFSNANGASFVNGPVAANSIATAFWSGPENLSAIALNVQDSMGNTRAAQVFFASRKQINYLIPDGTALGQATVTITGALNPFSAPLKIVAVAPGVFNGVGLAVGAFDTVDAKGNQTFTSLVNADASGALHPTPIDLTAGQIYLELYGTGIRGHANPVTATVGGATVPTLFAGAQGIFSGEDQINLQLPASLAGAGLVSVTLNVDGQISNPVRIQIK